MLEEGAEFRRQVCVLKSQVDQFASVSGDTNPLHMSGAAARRMGYQDRVVHGALLGGYVSGLIGTLLPTKDIVMHSMSLSCRKPAYIGDDLTILARVVQRSKAAGAAILKIELRRAEELLAKGKVQIGIING